MDEDTDDTESPTPPEGAKKVVNENTEGPPEEMEFLEENDLDWMTKTDISILKTLMTDLTLSPSIIAENIDRSREAVSRRLNTLQAGGMVEKVDRGKYEITPRGRSSWAAKSMSAEELRELDDE
jgi:DNA-binding MarR family transcriptional regulator